MPIPGGGPLILSQLSASGPPAAHVASHAENGSDEIFVENLGAISVVTTDALMPDGAGGLVFGSPAPAAHALGGAQHTADSLANLNTKVSDAVLVDSADVMLLDGTQAMTGTMTTQDIIPDGDGTRTSGSNGAAWLGIVVRNIRADTGQSLFLARDDGAAAVAIPTGLGQVQILSTFGLVLTAATFFRANNDLQVRFGTSNNVVMAWDTFQANDHFILGVDSVTNVILITDQDRIGTLDLGIAAQSQPAMFFHDGSLTTTNLGRLGMVTSQFRMESVGSIEQIIGGALIARVDAIGYVLRKTSGADPIDNTTGIDSRKLGFETRVWDGAVPQTRTGFIRAEDVSGVDDQIRFAFSSDDNGGAENDFLTISRTSAGTVTLRPATGENLDIQRADGVGVISVQPGVTVVTGTFRHADSQILSMGNGNDFQWVYEAANQTNNTLLWGTQGTEGNTVVFTDKARFTLDHVVGTPSTPTFRYHDGSATAGNWGSITHDGTNLVIVPNVGAVRINQATNMRSLEIDSEATSQPVINILSPATTTGPVFDVDDADALTTGQIINLKSNSASVGARALVRIHNDNTLAVGAVPLDIIQDALKEAAALDLGALDMGFINFKATADADAVSAISTLTTSGAVQGHVQMLVNGVSRWFAFLADPS